MKKLVATAPRVAALVEYEDRPVAVHEVKIRARFGAPKHGTEVVDFRAASPFIDEEFNAEWQMFTPREEGAARGIEFGKFQLGNMIVGDIIECGADVTEYQIGDRVCCYGPLQETVIVNAVNNYKLRKMPQGSSWKNAVCYDPAQFAMSGVRDANVRVGDFVVVVGLGAIGQIAIQLAKKAGASVVIGVDPIEHRCEIARRHGADHCLNPIGTDVGLEIKKLTGKQGADVIIETSGFADALQSALRGLAYGGTLSYVAFAKPFAAGFNLGREAHFNNAKIVFSRACSEPNPDYLLPERFTPQQCAANLAFYEPRTIHDSSLSKAIHGIVTARCGDTEGAYVLWRDGVAIDLGDDPHSSDDGIHAAATGAIWSGVIQGFAGVQIVEGELHLAPKLPAHWRKLSFPLRWRNAQMRFCFEHDAWTVESSAPVTLTLWGKTLNVSGLQIFARKDFLAPIIGTATTEGRYDA